MKGETDAKINRELVMDTISEHATKKGFWDSVYKAAPEFVKSMVLRVKKIVNRFKFNPAYKTSKYFKNLKRVQRAIEGDVGREVKRGILATAAKKKQAQKMAVVEEQFKFEEDRENDPVYQIVQLGGIRITPAYQKKGKLIGELAKASTFVRTKVFSKDAKLSMDAMAAELGMSDQDLITLLSKYQPPVRPSTKVSDQTDIPFQRQRVPQDKKTPTRQEAERINEAKTAKAPLPSKKDLDPIFEEAANMTAKEQKKRGVSLVKRWRSRSERDGIIAWNLRTSAGRFQDISQKIRDVIQKQANTVMLKTSGYMKRVEPFLKKLDKFSNEDYRVFDIAAKNSNNAEATKKVNELVKK